MCVGCCAVCSASLARTVSERLRSEAVWLMKEVTSHSLCCTALHSTGQVNTATSSAQRDSNFRLEEKLRDTENWRGELQGERGNVVCCPGSLY